MSLDLPGRTDRRLRGRILFSMAKGCILSIWTFLVSFEDLKGADNRKVTASERPPYRTVLVWAGILGENAKILTRGF